LWKKLPLGVAHSHGLRLIRTAMTQAQATPPPIAPSAAPRAAAPRNFISQDVEIKGTVIFEGNLTSNGRIQGEILSSGHLTIGATGVVDGDIQASAVAVYGTVNGNITVKDRCELKGDAELIGDLDAPRLVIEEGVTLVGTVKVGPHGRIGLKGSEAPKAIEK